MIELSRKTLLTGAILLVVAYSPVVCSASSCTRVLVSPLTRALIFAKNFQKTIKSSQRYRELRSQLDREVDGILEEYAYKRLKISILGGSATLPMYWGVYSYIVGLRNAGLDNLVTRHFSNFGVTLPLVAFIDNALLSCLPKYRNSATVVAATLAIAMNWFHEVSAWRIAKEPDYNDMYSGGIAIVTYIVISRVFEKLYKFEAPEDRAN